MSNDPEPTAEDRTAERWAWILWGGLVATALAPQETWPDELEERDGGA